MFSGIVVGLCIEITSTPGDGERGAPGVTWEGDMMRERGYFLMSAIYKDAFSDLPNPNQVF